MNHNLLVITPEADEYVDLLLARSLPQLEITGCNTAGAAEQLIERADILLGPPAMLAPLLDRAERLQWVQSTFAGVDLLCRPGLRRDYRLTGIKDLFGPLMSEYVFAYILSLERQLFQLLSQQKGKRWRPLPYRGLQGLVLGVCGFGSIGQHIARTAACFGMRSLAYKRTPDSSPLVERVYSGNALGEFLAEPDYLVLALPDTPATRGLLDRRALHRMKESAVVFNVGRGSAVVEADMAEALRGRQIRAAVLDVFAEEPLPQDSPLWDLPNCLITPHISAVSFPRDIVSQFCANYLLFREGRAMERLIDFERGY